MSFTLAYYPGEVIVENNTMGIENLVYTIINNETEIPDLYVEINKDNITIELPQDMAPSSFDIVFIEEQTREIVQIIRSRGSSRTKYVDRNVTVKEIEYVDKEVIKEVEVEKTKKETLVIEKGYSLWHVLLAMAFVAALLLTPWKKEKKKD